MRVSLLIATLVVLCAPAHAAAFRVEIAGGWEADAVAAALGADLASEPAELALRGELRGDVLRYAIVRPGGAPVRGEIPLAGLDRAQLAGIVRDQVHRIVRPAAETAPEPPAELAAPAGIGGALAALAALAGVLAIPIVLAGRRAPRLRGTRRLALVVGGLAVVAYVLAVHGERVPELGGWVFLAGGLAWGALAVVALPVALPPLAGLYRVEAGELARALAAWAATATVRTLALAVVAAPLVVAVWLVGDALGLPRAIGFGVVAPLLALALRLAWRALVELLAVRLDARLIDGDGDAAQPWHPHMRAYLVGYLRRANLAVDDELLERMRFVAGRDAEAGVAVYGGGLTHTRVVIPRAMLEHALAPYGRPHDYAMPRVSTLHWTHWNAGLVMPSEPGEHLATRDDRRPHETVEEGEHARLALGEPPTLSGIIEPRAFDPRTSYRPTEDPLFLDWDPGEEHDGTDAGDKDYLFGALVHALGIAQRREDGAAVLGWVRRSQARRGSALGDVAVALGGARHHFAQYVAWLAWRRDDLITARAYVPVLEQTSRAIVAALASAKAPRLARLVPLLTAASVRRSRRRLALAVAAVVGLGAVTTLVVQAVLYHPTYEARMKSEQEHGK